VSTTVNPGMSEWGNPSDFIVRYSLLKISIYGYIGSGREPAEVNHLSKPRKRNNSLSSGERKGRSPNPVLQGVVGPSIWYTLDRRSGLESRTTEGESPVFEIVCIARGYPEYRGTREILWESRGTNS